MKRISRKALALRTEVRKRILQMHPALRPRALVAAISHDAIVFGRGSNRYPVCLGVRARLEHMHIVGTTGGGKTRLIQHCACQDIVQGRGVCIVDPHGNHPGSLYRSMIAWLSKRKFAAPPVIHLIDPNAGTHVTGFNPLALPSAEYEPTVIAEAMQQAFERVWGEDMNTKPTMQRVLSTILSILTELKLTLAEAQFFFDPDDSHGIRSWAMQELQNEEARNELAWLHAIASDSRSQHDFRQEVTGPRNRLAKLTKNETIKLTVSQDTNGIDFRAALDQGHIILANLSPGPRAGDEAVQLLGRLLTRSIFFHTVRRERPDRPFFFYLDECQLYLSGDVSRMLAESRKYGTGVVLAHQTLSQLRTAGEDLIDAIKSTTNIKVVTRIKDPVEAAELADMVIQHNLEAPVNILVRPTLLGHEIGHLNSQSESEQYATGELTAETVGESVTESEMYTRSVSTTESASNGISTSKTLGVSDGFSSSNVETQTTGNSTTINFAPADILALPSSASGNTIGETAGTFSGMGLASPTRYLVGDVRTEPAAMSGVSVGQTRQRSTGRTDAFSSGSNRSSGTSISTQRGTSRATSDAWTKGTAYSVSHATTRGLSHSRGVGASRGWSESLQPILGDRPTAVHSLENARYMAGEVLRNFEAGQVAISFVDAGGLKTAVVRVAHVKDCELSPQQFEKVRDQMFTESPSAMTINEARTALIARQSGLKQRAKRIREAEPNTPEQFRTKRKRRNDAEATVDVHGEQSPPKRAPVKGPDRQRRRP